MNENEMTVPNRNNKNVKRNPFFISSEDQIQRKPLSNK